MTLRGACRGRRKPSSTRPRRFRSSSDRWFDMATRSDVLRLIGSRSPSARFALVVGQARGTRSLTDRRPWTYLLGEDWPTGVPLPASEGEALSLPPFGRGLALLANAV